jgi:regulator of PEP synthase PpsR (kinase-PPPase family)
MRGGRDAMTEGLEEHVHLISDSTGETLQAIARASLARFGSVTPRLHTSVFVRTSEDLAAAMRTLRRHRGLVFYTLVDPEHRSRLQGVCAELGVVGIAPLDPVVAALSRHFGQDPEQAVGMQHRITPDYFERITALDYAIANDDGALGSRFARADVILAGVSRTSKTPTCIYLAYRGVKAANMPLVPGRTPPEAFFRALDSGIPVIGLVASPARLAQIRGQRLEALGDRPSAYADPDRIRDEVAEARLFFERHRIPVIDITRRSIEETAAAVMAEVGRQRTGAATC